MADSTWLEKILSCLEIQKNPWVTGPLTVASFLFWQLVRTDVIPTPDSPLWETGPVLAMLIFGARFVGSLGEKQITPRINRRREQKSAEASMAHMTEREKKLIGSLLHGEERVLRALETDRRALRLVEIGIMKIIKKDDRLPAKVSANWTFSVPEHIWEVLERNRDSFPKPEPP